MKALAKAAFLVLVGSGLGACSIQELGARTETPVQCAQRWDVKSTLWAEAFGDDPAQKLYPVYTYDVRNMDGDAFKDWTGLAAPANPDDPPMHITVGGDQQLYNDWLNKAVSDRGAAFQNNDISVIRERGASVPVSEITAQGCAKSGENVRLIRIDFSIEAFGSAGNPALGDGTIITQSRSQD